jgi:hypothetical protein
VWKAEGWVWSRSVGKDIWWDKLVVPWKQAGQTYFGLLVTATLPGTAFSAKDGNASVA